MAPSFDRHGALQGEARPSSRVKILPSRHRLGRSTPSRRYTARPFGAPIIPASSAYPYYKDDEKAWDAGLEIDIAPR